MAKLCPSAQPGMENCKVLGTRRSLGEGGPIAWLARGTRSRGIWR